jgi:hypothetical protein
LVFVDAFLFSQPGSRSDEIFTIHFPMGAKKSMIMDPAQQLKVALDKICVARGTPSVVFTLFVG